MDETMTVPASPDEVVRLFFDTNMLCTLLRLARDGDQLSLDMAFAKAADVLDQLEKLRPVFQELNTRPR